MTCLTWLLCAARWTCASSLWSLSCIRCELLRAWAIVDHSWCVRPGSRPPFIWPLSRRVMSVSWLAAVTTYLPALTLCYAAQVERLQRKFASIHSTLAQQGAAKRSAPSSPRIAAKMGPAAPRGQAASAIPVVPPTAVEAKVGLEGCAFS